ncbi:MAG: LacI family DNA-binding transcriptional regulator [Sphingomonas fennica]
MKQSDIARLANVSVTTVSRALAGHPTVNRETQARIRAIASEHGFRPNQLARNLRLGQTRAIGIVLPLGHERGQHLSDPFFLTMLGLLADTLTERDYDILLSRIIPDGEAWLDRLVDGGRVDGLILIGQSDQYAAIEAVARRFRPMAVWGVARPGQAQATVGSDNVLGGRMAADHLLSIGRRNLLFVGNPRPPEYADRLAGFTAAAEAGGATVSILPIAMTPEEAHAAMLGRLAAGPVPDGIFCASDVTAMNVLRALADRGVAVPGDTAVIGYDDVAIAAQTSPPLTTIAQDIAGGAARLVEIVLGRIAGEAVDGLVLPPRLVVRGSTAD